MRIRRTAPISVEAKICPEASRWWYAHGNRIRWNCPRREFDNVKAGTFDLSLAWSQILHGFRDDRQIRIRLSGLHLEYIFAINKLLSNTSYEIPGKEYWPSASTRAISAATGSQKWTSKKPQLCQNKTTNIQISNLNKSITTKIDEELLSHRR